MQIKQPSSTATRSLLLAVERFNSPLAVVDGPQVRVQGFSPYGVRSSPDGATGALGFNGEYLERSGLYLPGSYRAYSPALRRFCQPDNLSPFAAGGLNAYAWCLGDPVNRIDPSGHMALGVFVISSVIAGFGLTIGATFVKDEKTKGVMYVLGGIAFAAAIAGIAYLGGKRIGRLQQARAPQSRLQDAQRVNRQLTEDLLDVTQQRNSAAAHAYALQNRLEQIDNTALPSYHEALRLPSPFPPSQYATPVGSRSSSPVPVPPSPGVNFRPPSPSQVAMSPSGGRVRYTPNAGTTHSGSARSSIRRGS